MIDILWYYLIAGIVVATLDVFGQVKPSEYLALNNPEALDAARLTQDEVKKLQSPIGQIGVGLGLFVFWLTHVVMWPRSFRRIVSLKLFQFSVWYIEFHFRKNQKRP